MILQALAILIPPPLIAAIALAADRPDNFISSHPDVAQWVMLALFAALCGMVAVQWRGVLADQKKLKKDFTEAQSSIVLSMQTIANEVKDVCSKQSDLRVEQAVMKQHCKDVCDFQDGETWK